MTETTHSSRVLDILAICEDGWVPRSALLVLDRRNAAELDAALRSLRRKRAVETREIDNITGLRGRRAVLYRITPDGHRLRAAENGK